MPRKPKTQPTEGAIVAYKGRELTAAVLRSIVYYDPGTGIFTWLPRAETSRHGKAFNTVYAGKTAGSPHSMGYISLLRTVAHRLAWLYVHGRWPVDQIDHINGDRTDNRIANLRECSNAENCQNVRAHRDGTSRYVGVSYSGHSKSRPWQAAICVRGKQRNLGYFATEEDALAARISAKRAAHPFHPENPNA